MCAQGEYIKYTDYLKDNMTNLAKSLLLWLKSYFLSIFKHCIIIGFF